MYLKIKKKVEKTKKDDSHQSSLRFCLEMSWDSWAFITLNTANTAGTSNSVKPNWAGTRT